MQPYYPSTIREEELKNRVAADFFGRYDCTRIVGNIDFCVSAKARDTNQMTFMPEEPLFWVEEKIAPPGREPYIVIYAYDHIGRNVMKDGVMFI